MLQCAHSMSPKKATSCRRGSEPASSPPFPPVPISPTFFGAEFCQMLQMHSSYPSTMFGVAAFTTNASSYYYELLEPLTLDPYPVVVALEEVAASSL